MKRGELRVTRAKGEAEFTGTCGDGLHLASGNLLT